MKTNLVFSFLLLLISFSGCTDAPDAELAKTGNPGIVSSEKGQTFRVLPSKSSVEWIGTKLTGRHNGSIQIKEGKLILNEGHLTGGNFILDMNTIDVMDLTGEDKTDLEDHLKDSDFFDVKKYPQSEFTITQVKTLSDSVFTHEITGNLALHGVTKSISFPAVLTIDQGQLLATANFNIKRSLWNLNYTGSKDNFIRDEINFRILLSSVTE
jgi:polyisoprenoid-binding protein YceI